MIERTKEVGFRYYNFLEVIKKPCMYENYFLTPKIIKLGIKENLVDQLEDNGVKLGFKM